MDTSRTSPARLRRNKKILAAQESVTPSQNAEKLQAKTPERFPGRPGRIGLVLIFSLLSAWSMTALADEVKFSASVNRTRVPLDGQLKLTIAVSVPDKRKMGYMELPDTGSLQVISTSREQSMSFSFSGGSSQYQKFTNTVLVLRPTKVGNVTIGSGELKYAGKVYKTKPVQVVVGKGKARRPGPGRPAGPTSPLPGWPRGQPDDDWFRDPFEDMMRRPEPIGEKDIFIRAYATPDLVVEGQQITMTVVVYSRVGARIAGVRWPKLDPFYSLDRDVSKASTEEKFIDGVRYQFKVLNRRALFPMGPGEFTIDPIEVEVEASSSPFFPADSRKLRSRPIKIKVEPLPAGAPEGFHRSNVGRFSLNGRVDANDVKLNQPVTYTLTVRGTGNIQNLRAPELPTLEAFKVFDPTVDVQQSKRGRTVKGSKTFEYILLPLKSGELAIPSLKFSYYDPETGQYRTAETKAETIRVQAGGAGTNGVDGASGREKNVVAGGAFKPIRFESDLRGFGRPFYRHPAFVPALVVPPLAYLLILFGMLLRNLIQTDSPRSRMRRAWAEARRHFKNAGRAASSGRATVFYSELKDALLEAVASRTGDPAQGLQLAELLRKLKQRGVSDEALEELAREVENCDFGRFAPAQTRGGEMASAHERTGRIIKALWKERVAVPRELRR